MGTGSWRGGREAGGDDAKKFLLLFCRVRVGDVRWWWWQVVIGFLKINVRPVATTRLVRRLPIDWLTAAAGRAERRNAARARGAQAARSPPVALEQEEVVEEEERKHRRMPRVRSRARRGEGGLSRPWKKNLCGGASTAPPAARDCSRSLHCSREG